MNKIRYKNKIGTLQYKRDFVGNTHKSTASVNIDSVPTLGGIKDKVQNTVIDAPTKFDLIDIESQMKEIQSRSDESNKKLDYIIDKFKSYENASGVITTEDGMIVYDAGVESMQSGDVYWEENN